MKSLHEAKDKDVPSFFENKKEVFLAKCEEMGLDLFEVKDFLDEKGLPEYNHELLIDNLKNRAYLNPLKIKKSINK